jgi:hypothetical protein
MEHTMEIKILPNLMRIHHRKISLDRDKNRWSDNIRKSEDDNFQ